LRLAAAGLEVRALVTVDPPGVLFPGAVLLRVEATRLGFGVLLLGLDLLALLLDELALLGDELAFLARLLRGGERRRSCADGERARPHQRPAADTAADEELRELDDGHAEIVASSAVAFTTVASCASSRAVVGIEPAGSAAGAPAVRARSCIQ